MSILDFALFITVQDPDTCYWTTPLNKRTRGETSATGVLLTCFNSLTFFTFDELISLLVRTMCASASSSRDVLATYLQLPADIQTLPASRTKRPGVFVVASPTVREAGWPLSCKRCCGCQMLGGVQAALK